MNSIARELLQLSKLNGDVVVSAELLERAASAIGLHVCNCNRKLPGKVKHNGKCLTRKQWAEELGLHPDTIRWRLKNWGCLEKTSHDALAEAV